MKRKFISCVMVLAFLLSACSGKTETNQEVEQLTPTQVMAETSAPETVTAL